jgi:BASS family bile acid:Na+ symporter
MFRLRDLILLIVIYSSLAAGVLFPRVMWVFQPLPLFCMMSLLFLSFLPIRIGEIQHTIRSSALVISSFLFIRMILLPVIIFYLFHLLWPAYSLAALLLSGISTGVVAPFISGLLQANTPMVLVMVVSSSLLVPFTLPALVDSLCGQSMDISLWAMMRLLLLVVFIPVILAQVVRRFSQALTGSLIRNQFLISLFLFAITNLGIFSQYSEFFYQAPMTIVLAAVAAFALGFIYLVSGLVLSWGRRPEDRLAAVISLGLMNNVLVIVFSSQFFTPIEPTVAAMYMIPFFGLIIPLRAYRGWKVGK